MPQSERIKILIVDDLPEKLLVYQSVLEELGEELVLARSGPEALKHLLVHDFAVILLDVNMPGMDGFETAALIRARKRCAHTPIIFITAFADDLHTGKGYAHGAVDYILSPVRADVLRTKVKVFVELFRLNQQVREQAARQIAVSERERARLAAVLETATDFVGSLDAAGRLINLNGAGRRMLDIGGLEDLTQSGNGRMPWIDHELHRDGLATAMREGVWFGESALVSRGGAQIPVSEVILAHKNEAGQTESFSIIARDITERKQTEAELERHRTRLEELVRERTADLEASHARLRLADRMASIGTLAAGLGHDMGNLLLPIRARLEALNRLELSDTARQHVQAIDTASEYLRRLNQGLRLFALDPDDAAPTDEGTNVARWWPDVEPFLRHALPRSVTLEAEFAPDLPAIAMPSHRFTQTIYNLVQNAGDALRDRLQGNVRLSIEEVDDGSGVVVSVADDGPGMTEEVKRRCMEPFFTTRTRQISTGLGLALVRGAVFSAGGSIQIDSTLGKGTTFRLKLPAVAPAAEAEDDRGRRPRVAWVTLNDPRMGAYVASILGSLNVQVRTARGPNQDDVDLWVLDGFNGYLEQVHNFVRGRELRQAVIFGGESPPELGEQVTCLEAKPQPSRIRVALLAAVQGRATAVQEVA